jgi:hypothetical protein
MQATDDAVGLALSGGGIRSATFGLGVLQSLAKARLLRRVDMMSTVSGGGFIGVFLGRLYTRDNPQDRAALADRLKLGAAGQTASMTDLVEEALVNPESPPVDWLRENGRYLSPTGSGDTLMGVGVMIRNWFAARLTLWSMFLFVFLGAIVCRYPLGFQQAFAADGFRASPYLLLVPIVLVAATTPLAWAYWHFPLFEQRGLGSYLVRGNVLLIGAALAGRGLTAIEPSDQVAGWMGAFVVVAVLSGLSRGLLRRRGLPSPLQSLSLLLFALLFATRVDFTLPPLSRSAPTLGSTSSTIQSFLLPWRKPTPADCHFPGMAAVFGTFVVLACLLVWFSFCRSPARAALSRHIGRGAAYSAVVSLVFAGAIWSLVRPQPDWSYLAVLFGLFVILAGFFAWPLSAPPRQVEDAFTWRAGRAMFIAVVAIVGLAWLLRWVASPQLVGRIEIAQQHYIVFLVGAALLRLGIPDQWLGRSPRVELADKGAHGAALVLAAATSLFVLPWDLYRGWMAIRAGGVIASFSNLSGAIACIAMLSLMWLFGAMFHRRPAENNYDQLEYEARVEHALTVWLRNSGVVAALVASFAMFDSCGETLYEGLSQPGLRIAALWAGAIAFLQAALSSSRNLAILISGAARSPRARPPMAAVAMLVALLLVLAECLTLSVATYAIAWLGRSPGPQGMSPGWLLLAASIAGFFAFFLSRGWDLINRSTFNPLYAARLSRAYMGASNPARWEERGRAVTQVVRGDVIKGGDYRPHEFGGPLHLINVTINETASGRSQIEQVDRKGLNMALGPCGASVHGRHHALWEDQGSQPLNLRPIAPEIPQGAPPPFRVFELEEGKLTIPCEALSAALATSISGAAFTTGAGRSTNLGTSLLCGLLNIRLGYWWNSGVHPDSRKNRTTPNALGQIEQRLARVFPVQASLIQEFTARFHGPARRQWYLSDGGHYENLGGYELIRRRLPWILISDAEADPDYRFDGMGRLASVARIDFGAEVEFLSSAELDAILDPQIRQFYGTADQLRRGRWTEERVFHPAARQGRTRLRMDEARDDRALAHIALAWVRYRDNDGKLEPLAQSVVIYVKPTLTGDEPLDVTHYHAEHPDFPQESTLNQYFNESQWESYRKLGEHIGDCLLRSGPLRQHLQSPAEWINGQEPGLPQRLFVRARPAVLLEGGREVQAPIPLVPGTSWHVAMYLMGDDGYLSIENRTDRDETYLTDAPWVAQFANSEIVSQSLSHRSRVDRAGLIVGSIVRGRVMVPARSTILLRALN